MVAIGKEGEERVHKRKDFFWSYTDLPEPQPLGCPQVVLLQLWTATYLHDAKWLKILNVAYFFGSFLNNDLFLAIHELNHNLAFPSPSYNCLCDTRNLCWRWYASYILMAGHFISEHYVFNQTRKRIHTMGL